MTGTTLPLYGAKALRRALLLAICTSAVFASVGATPAMANYCGGIHYYNDAYVGEWRLYTVNITEVNDAGFGTLTQVQRRWRDRKGYKTCTETSSGRKFHLHYRSYGEDARTRTCYHYHYWPIGCGSWTYWPWKLVSPWNVYTHWHWV